MRALHEVEDAAKVETLAEAMVADGWVGAPLVVWDDALLTGVHRYAAAMSLDWTDAEVPTIAVEDVFAEAGLDFAAVCAEEMCDDSNSADLVYVLNVLPAAVRDAYGIDLH